MPALTVALGKPAPTEVTRPEMLYVAREPVKLMLVRFEPPTFTGFVNAAVNVHPGFTADTEYAPENSPTSEYVPSEFVHVTCEPLTPTRTPSTPMPFSVTVPV